MRTARRAADGGGSPVHPGGSSRGGAGHAGCAARRRAPTAAARAAVPGRRGHPIWFRRELAGEFLALPPDGAARDVVRAHAAETEFLDVDDPGILADIDDPAAYARLTGATA